MNQIPTTKINSLDVLENRIEEVFRHIRNGGSLTNLAKMWKFDYSEFMKKVRSNPELLKEYQSAIEDRKEWAKERIYEELNYMGTYNIKDAVKPDGTLKTIHELPEDLARSIKEIDVDGGIKFTDKRASLADKQKLLGLTVEKLELTGKLTLADLINQAKKVEE